MYTRGQARVDAVVRPRFPRGVDCAPEEHPSAARWIADSFALSDEEVGELFGVSQQAAAGWLANGFPAAQQTKAAVVLEVARLLDHNILADRIGAIVRRPAEAYGGRTMLQMIAAGEHEDLLDRVRGSLDFGTTA